MTGEPFTANVSARVRSVRQRFDTDRDPFEVAERLVCTAIRRYGSLHLPERGQLGALGGTRREAGGADRSHGKHHQPATELPPQEGEIQIVRLAAVRTALRPRIRTAPPAGAERNCYRTRMHHAARMAGPNAPLTFAVPVCPINGRHPSANQREELDPCSPSPVLRPESPVGYSRIRDRLGAPYCVCQYFTSVHRTGQGVHGEGGLRNEGNRGRGKRRRADELSRIQRIRSRKLLCSLIDPRRRSMPDNSRHRENRVNRWSKFLRALRENVVRCAVVPHGMAYRPPDKLLERRVCPCLRGC